MGVEFQESIEMRQSERGSEIRMRGKGREKRREREKERDERGDCIHLFFFDSLHSFTTPLPIYRIV
jgi:hypothetical protein